MKDADRDNPIRPADGRAAGRAGVRLRDAQLDALARDTVPLPSAATWERMWDRIDAGVTRGESSRPAAPRRAPLPRYLRFWQPFAAAAACVLMIVSWAVLTAPRPSPSAVAFRPATDNNVNSLEAPGGGALLVSDGEGWVIVLAGDGGSDT